ncbi:phage head closure protein [Pseudomonas sp. 58(2021)]|uniref:phage head closure protein n=1 Tax=Pseudomonas sp. 58(2021) TaxID=2813330 RepID=UPI001A9E0318|nr:phage head closure protein [Pseudomonas sp. 58(2021)]
MQAGKLKHRVQIQHRITTQDPQTGEQLTPQWVEFATVYASVEDLSARDFIAAQAGQSEAKTRIVIRYRKGITAAMRVLLDDGTICGIVGPPLADAKSRREYLTLLVTSGVNDG